MKTMKNTPESPLNPRRYDIDWLRVIAIGLLLIYHIAIVFQPWGVFIGFITSQEPLSGLWPLMAMINVWRIPLLFYVSGMGVAFAMRKRNWKQLIGERARRILLPFIFGMFFIIPVYIFILQKYYKQDLDYMINPGHLWFLANICIYVVILSPLFFFMKRKNDSRAMSFLRKVFSSPAIIIITAAVFVAEVLLVHPASFELFAMTWHGFFLGMLAFFFGFCFVHTGNGFWKMLANVKWITLALAIGLYIIRISIFQYTSPFYLASIESSLWIFSLLGFGHRYLNRPGKLLSYLSNAAYPVYILHMVFLYLSSYFILPMSLPSWVEFLLIILSTFISCFLLYEFLLKRIPFIGVLFGLKVSGKERNPAEKKVLLNLN